jgi:hypothetical protein
VESNRTVAVIESKPAPKPTATNENAQKPQAKETH